jgi:hypothetical protein
MPWFKKINQIKGLSAPLVGSMIENSGLFFAYNQVQSLVRTATNTTDQSVPLSLPQLSACGFLSGAIVSMILTPVELVKCRMQLQGLYLHSTNTTAASVAGDTRPKVFRGPLHILTQTIRNEGVFGLYKGHLATFLREAGGGAAWFGTYEWVCKGMMERSNIKNKEDLTPWQMMGAGALAGMVSIFVVMFHGYLPTVLFKSASMPRCFLPMSSNHANRRWRHKEAVMGSFKLVWIYTRHKAFAVFTVAVVLQSPVRLLQVLLFLLPT